MTPGRSTVLVSACIVTALEMGSALVETPQLARIVLGVLVIFFLPGFGLISAVVNDRQLSQVEVLLATLGSSLAISTCVAVLLGATPVGLSRRSFAISLGGITIVLYVLALIKLKLSNGQRSSENAADGARW